MKILLVNDDGINAPGIRAMASALAAKHEVYIVAPASEQSGKSQALSVGTALIVREEQLGIAGVKKAYSVAGTPADCTKLGIERLLDEKPDMVISGINKGPNLGTDVLYSGTVGAALEGYDHGIRSLAVSMPLQCALSLARIAEIIADHLIYFYDSDELFMYNINFPAALKDDKISFVPARQGYRRYENEFDTIAMPDGSTAYVMQGRAKDIGNDAATDIMTTARGYISVTPLSIERTDFVKLRNLCRQNTIFGGN